MRIAIFGLPYSPNLGDGVIAECLASEIARQRPGARIVPVDLSGRGGWGAVTVRNRALALRVLAALPRPLRHALVRRRLGALLDRAGPEWRAALEGADLAVVGGGQLLSDADLNFPLKLGRLAGLLRQAGVPAALHGCGVARNWSRPGRSLFAALLDCELRQVGLRDAPSLAAWRDQLGAAAARGPDPVLTADPGLLAARVYGRPEGAGTGRIGLCITAAEVIAHHGGREGQGAGWFEAVARALLAEGHRLALFTNGAAEDDAALRRLAARLGAGGPGDPDAPILALPRPARPRELAHLVAGCRGIVAHRLHACILAHAYGVPSLGLGWDAKLESFFATADRPDAFLPAEQARSDRIAAALNAQLAGPPPDPEPLAREAQAAVTRLLALVPAP